MNNLAAVLPMTQQTTRAAGEGIFIHFLIIIETWVATTSGSKRGLDLLIDNPAGYWTESRWEYLSVDDVIWLVQVCEIPVQEKVSRKWACTGDKAKAIIYKKTQGMAKRAKQLLAENKAQLLREKT